MGGGREGFAEFGKEVRVKNDYFIFHDIKQLYSRIVKISTEYSRVWYAKIYFVV